MSTFKIEAQEIRQSNEYWQIKRKYYRISYYIKINFPKNHRFAFRNYYNYRMNYWLKNLECQTNQNLLKVSNVFTLLKVSCF